MKSKENEKMIEAITSLDPNKIAEYFESCKACTPPPGKQRMITEAIIRHSSGIGMIQRIKMLAQLKRMR